MRPGHSRHRPLMLETLVPASTGFQMVAALALYHGTLEYGDQWVVRR